MSKKKKKKVTSNLIKQMIKDGRIKPTKICDTCGEEKNLKGFQEDKRNKDYFKPTCNACLKLIRDNPRTPIIPGTRQELKIDTTKQLSERFSMALIQQFGDNLDILVTYLLELLNNSTTTPTIKLGIVNFIADRTMGKPTQTQVIEQKVIQVNITKPDLSTIDINH